MIPQWKKASLHDSVIVGMDKAKLESDSVAVAYLKEEFNFQKMKKEVLLEELSKDTNMQEILSGPELTAVYSPGKIMKSSSIKDEKLIGLCGLADATQVYQKVHGTSKNSTYFVAALFEGAGLAVRRKHNKLSVRVEGAKLNEYSLALKSAGFSLKEGYYASCHYDSPDTDIAVKTIGAIMAKMGLHLVNQSGDLNKLVGTV